MAGLLGNPLLAVEREEIGPEGVERREEGRDRAGVIKVCRRTNPSGPRSPFRPPRPGWRPCSRSRRRGRCPARARQPKRKVQCVIGIRRRRPPNWRMSITPPMACITLPAPRNSRALKKACVNRWNMPAVTPSWRARAQGEEHVAELADRRIGQDPLQIGLRQGDQRGQQGREAADRGHHVPGRRATQQTAACSGRPGRRRP